MKVPGDAFRQYDIRGIVGEQLTPQLAHAVGRALTTHLQRSTGNDRPAIAVGRDNRPSGTTLSAAVRDGIVAAGGVAVDVGMLPTPALYFSVHYLKVDAGLQVTGSHNPPEFNGFKMVAGGAAVYGDTIQLLARMIESDDLASGNGQMRGAPGMLAEYKKAILDRNGPLLRPVKVVVDCGNGVASLIAVEVLHDLGAEVVPLYCESDGSFPNHHPDPTEEKNLVDLIRTVKETGAELGVAFDGDGDRIGAVDEKGEVVWGDNLLVLFGRDLVERMGTGHPVIFDVKCSNVLGAELDRAGLQPVMWKTGHSLIKARMKELGAPLAGEMSGHMFFAGDYFGFDDALFAAARLLDYLSRNKGPLSALTADIPATVTTPEIRVECPDSKKFDLVSEAADHFSKNRNVLTLDGARIEFDNGWGLIRASNTQPVIVMRFEAGSLQELNAYKGEVAEWLRARGIDFNG